MTEENKKEENTAVERPVAVERQTVITWPVIERPAVTEWQSKDGRWHLEINADGGELQFYIYNSDSIIIPGACGSTINECWSNFVSNCEEYLAKVAAVQAEAEDILAEIEKGNKTKEENE